jgi:hypothetical protein
LGGVLKESLMTEKMLADAALFERIRYWKDFRPSAGHLFPTNDSLRWFIRSHEPALLAAGALFKLTRGSFIDPEPFRAIALALMNVSGSRGAKS